MTSHDPNPPPPADDPDVTVGAVIHELRLKSGRSLAGLSAELGVDQLTLAEIEAGTFDPGWKLMEGIARSFDTSLRAIAEAVLAKEAASAADGSSRGPT